MTPTNFFYWLQGYFEILASCADAVFDTPLTPEQMLCVSAHIDLVRASLGREPMPERLSQIALLVKLGDRMESTNMIRAICAEQFEHVIDPAQGDPDKQAKLNHIHHWHHGERPVMRC